MTVYWICIGSYPKVAPCDAYGTTDKAAERHVKETGHAVSTGTNPDALARAARHHHKEEA